jgi:hypothetical protein
VDRSADNGFHGDLPAALAKLAERFPSARSPRVTLANYETLSLPEEAPPGSLSLAALPLRGGFAPELALAQAIRRHRDADLDADPVALPPPAPRLRDPEPEKSGAARYRRGRCLARPPTRARNPRLRRRWRARFLARKRRRGDAPAAPRRLGPSAPARTFASLRPRHRAGRARIDANEPWARAAALQLAQQDHDRAPGDAGVNMKELVTSSRESGVMLPSTSYIVVENAAQWRMLDVSERQKLDQNAALDFKETPAPAWVWLSAGFAAWLALRHSRASRVTE